MLQAVPPTETEIFPPTWRFWPRIVTIVPPDSGPINGCTLLTLGV